MSLIKLLERAWIAVQILFFAAAGLGPLIAGVGMIYDSQTSFYEREYQEEMYLGIGILCIVIGILVGWACFVRIVYLIRYNNSQK